MKSQFQNPNLSHEIVVSLFESEFKFSNPNLSHEIAVSLFESEFKFKNLNLKETRNSYFYVTPKNHRLMFVS